MPSRTAFAKLYLYDAMLDKEQVFGEYRENVSGLKEDSNMQVIDTFLKDYDLKIKNIGNSSSIYDVLATTTDPDNKIYIGTNAEIKEYKQNMLVIIHFQNNISSSTTININSFGTKPLMKYNSLGSIVELGLNDCFKNVGYLFQYDGAKFILLGANFREVIVSEVEPQNQVIGGVWYKLLSSGEMTSYLKKEDGTYTEMFPKTKSNFVYFLDNKTLEQFKSETNSSFTQVDSNIESAKTSAIASANTYTDAEIVKAKAYTDTAKTSAIATANTYTDIAKADAKTYTDSQKIAAVSEAKTYTDTAKTSAIASAKTYTDAEIVKAKAYTDTAETNAINSAKTYTDTQKTAAVSEAKSYTDTKVTGFTKRSSIDVTLTAAGWTGSTAPFSQVEPATGVTTSNTIIVSQKSNANLVQMQEWGNCIIKATTQAANSVTFQALQQKPTMDLIATIIILT